MMLLSYGGIFVTAIVVFGLAPFVTKIFNLTPQAQNLAVLVIRACMVANIFFWPMSFTMPNILRGAGDAKYTMIISNISMWLFRVLGSFLISIWILRIYPGNTPFAFFWHLDWNVFGLDFPRNYVLRAFLWQKMA